jgi:hypothetical protein
MARIRRIIRKLESPHDGALDEQAWPVNVALVLLGSFSLGASLAYLRWGDPNWWADARFYVVLIPLIVAGSMVAFRFIDNKWFRRSMQLALVASAIFHVLVVILSAQAVVFTSLALEPKTHSPAADMRPENAVRISPELLRPRDDQPQDFERPVETQTPEVAPEEVKKEETEQESPRTPQPVPVPEPQRTERPALVKRPTTEQAAPRAAETPSKLSRNTRQQDVGPAVAKVEAQRPTEQPRVAKVDASVAGVSRQATEAKPLERNAAVNATSARPSDAALARKTPENAPKVENSATAALHRAVNQPNLTPKSQVNIADAPSVARRTAESEPLPRNTTANRQLTAGPRVEKSAITSTTSPTTPSTEGTLSSSAARAVPRQDAPASSAVASSAAGRTESDRAANIVTRAAEVESTTARNVAPTLSPGAATAVASRQPRASSETATRTQPSAEAPSAGGGTPSAGAVARATTSATPSSDHSATASSTPQRAARSAASAGSPANVEAPAIAIGSTASSEPNTEPARMALSRSQSGSAGAGNSPNLDRGSGAPDSPALVASTAGRRSQATSAGPPDAALTPSTAAARAQGRAAALSPSTPIAADAVANATEAGTNQVGELASSSASLTKAAGSAAAGEISAAKGTAEIDAGANTIVAEAGRSRPAGGGQPEMSFSPQTAAVARQPAAGSAQASLATDRVAAVPEAPAADGGGQPAALDPSAIVATRGNTASGAGGPSKADQQGPLADSTGGALVAKTPASRADESDSPAVAAAGDVAAPEKRGGGQQLATNAQAEMLQLAGGPTSGGGPEGVDLQAQGIEAAKTSGGATSQIVEGAIGAAAGPEVVDAFGPQGAGNVAGGKRTVSPATEDGPSVSDLASGNGPGKRAAETELDTGDHGQIEVPSVGPMSAVAQADLDHGMSSGVGRTASDAGEGLVINLDAPDGEGGISQVAAADVGINSRLARADSLEIGPQPSRFVGRRSGGIPGISTASVVPTDSFKKRAEGRAGRGSLPPQTEAAVELGLTYLARHQQQDGSWRLQGLETTTRSDPQMVSDTAATALAVLAFQGAGYNHREHKYAEVVRGGLDYLVQNQKEDGDLFVPLDDESNRSVWLYSHALASLALCEAYGMTQDPALKDAAQKSIDFIIAGQNKERGGWRYAPGVGSDTSVTGAMLVAMRSAELANLNVPKSAYDGVSKWLDLSQASPTQAHLYRYNPNAPDTPTQKHGRVASPTMTSLGLLMRLYLGWHRDNPNMVNGADYLKEHLPSLGTNNAPQRDTYYWYYATQVMFHMGGDHWRQWHEKLHALLINTQIKEGSFAGSWNPRLPVADRWGPHGGRLYVTALNLLSLEVQYRHLPTYEDTAK